MLKYYKNLIMYVSMFSSPNNGGGNLEQQKQKLISKVNNIELTQEQLQGIKTELRKKGINFNNYNIQIWRNGEIGKINYAKNFDELNALEKKYNKLESEIINKSIKERSDLKKEIPLLIAYKKKIKGAIPKTTPQPTQTPQTPTTTAEHPKTSQNYIPINLKKESGTWVKQSLTSDFFSDINSPTKDEVITVLKGFTGFKGMKEGESARVIYAIQVALNKLNIPIEIDGILGNDTKDAIKRFQKEQMGFRKINGNPGPKTIKALISKLEKTT